MSHKHKHHHGEGQQGPPQDQAQQTPASSEPPPSPDAGAQTAQEGAPAGPLAQAAPGAESAAPAEGAAAPENPPSEVEVLKAQSDDLLKRLQRVSADYLNYQKRIQKEIAQSRDFANEAILKAMLPVLDDIDRALELGASNHADDDPMLVGLRLVREKALAALSPFGLAIIESQGKPFDPEHHQAVSQLPTADCPPKTVVKELAKGYALRGRTIRPAMVVVSAEPKAES